MALLNFFLGLILWLSRLNRNDIDNLEFGIITNNYFNKDSNFNYFE